MSLPDDWQTWSLPRLYKEYKFRLGLLDLLRLGLLDLLVGNLYPPIVRAEAEQLLDFYSRYNLVFGRGDES